MSTHRPAILLAHLPGLPLFTTEDLDQIATVGTLLNREPVGSWDEPTAGELLPRAEVILGHWGCPPLDAALLDGAPRLGLFAYAAGTVKATVTPEVFDRGIRVTSGADANAEPVAEFTLAAILFANKDVFWRRDELRRPELRGSRQEADSPVGNYAKTVGIVGASLVGRRVIELLTPFPHLDVAVYDPFLSEGEAGRLGVAKLGLDELCRACDILSVHAPDLPSTRRMIGAAQLAALRTGATVINTARGALIDHDALLAELSAGRLTAVLDVTDPEPLPADHPLLTLPNVYVTPHLAGSEGTELARMTDHAIEEIRRWAAGQPPRNGVTRDQLDRLA